MVRSTKHGGKNRRKKYNFKQNANRQRWKNLKKKRRLACEEVDAAWDKTKSVQENMSDMGLVYDLNKALPIHKKKAPDQEDMLSPLKKGGTKKHVLNDLEASASQEMARSIRLSQPELRFCIYMMDRYGTDYEAMARDNMNHYQDTPKQIERKIKLFKSIPVQYNAYLRAKGLPVPKQQSETAQPQELAVEVQNIDISGMD